MRRKLLFLISLAITIHVIGSWMLAAGWAIWFAEGTGTSMPVALYHFVPPAAFIPRQYPVMTDFLTQAVHDSPPYDGVAFPLGSIIIVTWVAWLLTVVSICLIGFRLYRRASTPGQGMQLVRRKRGFEAVAATEPPSGL